MKCNLCGCDSLIPKYEILKFSHPIAIVECSMCGLIFQLNPPEHLDKLYNEGYYKGSNEYSYIDEREDMFLRNIENERRVKNLLQFFMSNLFSPSFTSLLDVGCSFGSLVDKACELGVEASGVDISGYIAGNSKKILQEDVCKSISGTYDMITMVEVIEHLSNPLKALKNCHGALSSHGVILIQTTNMDSVVRQHEKENSRYFLPGHLFYFSVKTLTAMLAKAGFKIEKIYHRHETGLIPALIRKSVCNMNRYKKYKLPDWLILLYTLTVHLLSKIHIGNFAIHNGMVVIARKVANG